MTVSSSWKRWEIKKKKIEKGEATRKSSYSRGLWFLKGTPWPIDIFTGTIMAGASIFFGPFLFSHPRISFLNHPLALQDVQPLPVSATSFTSTYKHAQGPYIPRHLKTYPAAIAPLAFSSQPVPLPPKAWPADQRYQPRMGARRKCNSQTHP